MPLRWRGRDAVRDHAATGAATFICGSRAQNAREDRGLNYNRG